MFFLIQIIMMVWMGLYICWVSGLRSLQRSQKAQKATIQGAANH